VAVVADYTLAAAAVQGVFCTTVQKRQKLQMGLRLH